MAGMICRYVYFRCRQVSDIGFVAPNRFAVIPYLRHGDFCLVRHSPAIRMAGYQCLTPNGVETASSIPVIKNFFRKFVVIMLRILSGLPFGRDHASLVLGYSRLKNIHEHSRLQKCSARGVFSGDAMAEQTHRTLGSGRAREGKGRRERQACHAVPASWVGRFPCRYAGMVPLRLQERPPHQRTGEPLCHLGGLVYAQQFGGVCGSD